MSRQIPKLNPKLILPVLSALGVVLLWAGSIINIPDYIELLSIKITYPSSCEFKIYDRLLKRHVLSGLLDYRSIKTDPDFKLCYEELERIDPAHLEGKLELLCFWVNTYNFLTIKCIADSYPISRLRQESAIKTFIIGARPYRLKQIADEVLPQLISSSDWRAIFLLCNGSASAPVIGDHAYIASRLDDDLKAAMHRFVLCPANYRLDRAQHSFLLSPFYRTNIMYIDRIYRSPFDMVNEQLPQDQKVELAKVYCNYGLPYDWRINDIALLNDLRRNDK